MKTIKPAEIQAAICNPEAVKASLLVFPHENQKGLARAFCVGYVHRVSRLRGMSSWESEACALGLVCAQLGTVRST